MSKNEHYQKIFVYEWAMILNLTKVKDVCHMPIEERQTTQKALSSATVVNVTHSTD